MNWVLLALQYTAVTSGTYALGWVPLAEFKTNAACVAASTQLAQSQAKIYANTTPRKFECVDKGNK